MKNCYVKFVCFVIIACNFISCNSNNELLEKIILDEYSNSIPFYQNEINNHKEMIELRIEDQMINPLSIKEFDKIKNIQSIIDSCIKKCDTLNNRLECEKNIIQTQKKIKSYIKYDNTSFINLNDLKNTNQNIFIQTIKNNFLKEYYFIIRDFDEHSKPSCMIPSTNAIYTEEHFNSRKQYIISLIAEKIKNSNISEKELNSFRALNKIITSYTFKNRFNLNDEATIFALDNLRLEYYLADKIVDFDNAFEKQ